MTQANAYKIGDVLPDGWVVGPISPDTGIVMAIEPESSALQGYKTWYQGKKHADALQGQGHVNARLPAPKELNALFNDVVKAGHNQHAQFNTKLSFFGKSSTLYWASSAPVLLLRSLFARVQYFGKGGVADVLKLDTANVRCVRDEAGLTLT